MPIVSSDCAKEVSKNSHSSRRSAPSVRDSALSILCRFEACVRASNRVSLPRLSLRSSRNDRAGNRAFAKWQQDDHWLRLSPARIGRVHFARRQGGGEDAWCLLCDWHAEAATRILAEDEFDHHAAKEHPTTPPQHSTRAWAATRRASPSSARSASDVHPPLKQPYHSEIRAVGHHCCVGRHRAVRPTHRALAR